MKIPHDLPDVRNAKPGTTAVYRLYDAYGALLYVGITNSPRHRFAQHAADKEWWDQVTTRRITWYPLRAQALRAEYAAIVSEYPMHNKMHNPFHRSRALYARRVRHDPLKVPGVMFIGGVLLPLGSWLGWWHVGTVTQLASLGAAVVAGWILAGRIIR